LSDKLEAGFPTLRFSQGNWAGRSVALDLPTLTLGRSLDNDIVVEDSGISRQHCRFERRGSQVSLVDLDSTNGTQVNGLRISESPLQDGDTLELGTGVTFRFLVLTAEEREIERNLLDSASKDSLTRVYHRRAWLEQAEILARRFHRRQRPVSLAVCTIEPKTNSSSQAADALLVELCRRTRALGREALVGRTEPRQIALVLPGFPLARALQRMQKLVQEVCGRSIEVGPEELVEASLSIGVVSTNHFVSLEELLCDANLALQKSLEGGANQVCGHQREPATGQGQLNSTDWLILQQKRETIRTRHRLPIWVRSENGDCEGELLDVGKGGMRIRLRQPLSPGWPVEISPKETVEAGVNMVVRWQRGEQCGLRFLEKSIESSWAEDLLRQLGQESQLFVDRRRHARLAWIRKFRFSIGQLVYEGEATSLGYGGLCASSPLPPPLQAEGQVQLEGLDVSARVVWVKNLRFGLHFAPLGAPQQKQLLMLMRTAQVETEGGGTPGKA